MTQQTITFLAGAAEIRLAGLAVTACGGGSAATGITYGLYMAALDAEEHAAEVSAGLVRRFDKLRWSEDPPADPLGGAAWGVGWP